MQSRQESIACKKKKNEGASVGALAPQTESPQKNLILTERERRGGAQKLPDKALALGQEVERSPTSLGVVSGESPWKKKHEEKKTNTKQSSRKGIWKKV